MINKDTKLYGSFSNNPGNNGCQFFNTAFEKHGINSIYKSFYSENIEETIQSVKHLKFGGFALSMPLKISVYNYLDEYDESVINIGSCNTVIIKDGKLHGYNTDWIGIYKFFENKNLKHVNIIGTGGFAKSIMYAFSKLNINFSIISRNDIPNIDIVENQYFINATPIEIVSTKNTIIDARPFTDTGKEIFLYQAKEQFKLYTEVDYE
jgi:shikimate dehydrogenase